MSHSLSQIYLHVVFTTKERRPFLADKQMREKMHAYLAGICKNQDSPALTIGGIEDHVHILCRLSKNVSVKDLIFNLKRSSSQWIKSQPGDFGSFYWQSGYAAFSISPSHVEAVRDYIRNQEEHHRKETFEDEFRRLCRKYGVELDDRYAWD